MILVQFVIKFSLGENPNIIRLHFTYVSDLSSGGTFNMQMYINIRGDKDPL